MALASKKFIKNTLRKFGIRVMSEDQAQRIIEDSKVGRNLALLMQLPIRHRAQLLDICRASDSQFGQDLFVLSELDFKRAGYFVEFGAADGLTLSNTRLLEAKFGWTGILAEPARCWHGELKRNRRSHIETSCVWRESGSTVTFNQTRSPDLSTIDSYSNADFHSGLRTKGRKYEVKTISLMDLLAKYNAPKVIDYLSIDTEGSEFEILNSFDFGKYQIRIITCEHNGAQQREGIRLLLEKNGYTRRYENLSAADDWYAQASLVNAWAEV